MRRRDEVDRAFERVFGDAVTVEGLRAPVKNERFPVMARKPEKREHHVFMVALEEDDLCGPALQLDKLFDNVTRGGSAINVVADKNDGISRSGRDRLDDRGQLVWTSMNIANREEPSLRLCFLAQYHLLENCSPPNDYSRADFGPPSSSN